MKVSGFTMVRNADKLYFPIKASILSILPLVDEFIIALGKGDDDDRTKSIIESIGSEKIIIYDRVWSESSYIKSKIFAEETDFALSKCTGDWCIYLQADEVIHEKDHQTILDALDKYAESDVIDGLLFNYHHFWGDYNHFLPYHGWYKNEIRIIKNNQQIYSYKDAQSFRKETDHKLRVAPIDAYIYHYGWVRPPSIMQSKKKIHESFHHGKKAAEKMYIEREDHFDYGALGRIPLFEGTHPTVMKDWIKKFDWAHQLNYSKNWKPTRPLHKHEQSKYRLLTQIENGLFNGRTLFGYSNWLIKKVN